MDIVRDLGKLAADGYYDHQATRISASNQFRTIIRNLFENIDTSRPEEKQLLKTFSHTYADDNIKGMLSNLVRQGTLKPEQIRYIQRIYAVIEQSRKLEDMYMKEMKYYVESEPIYTDFLKGIKGIGVVLAANMIKEFGYCEPSTHASGLWKLCGLHVVNGKGVKLKKGVKIDFSPRCRTLAFLIGDMFVKHRTPLYRGIYDNEKHRQVSLMANALCESCGKTPDCHKYKDGKYMCSGKKDEKRTFVFTEYYTPMNLKHCDLRARRKAEKIFLQHYWIKARTIKGLPVNMPFQFDKLGHDTRHYISPVSKTISAE